MSEAVFIYWLAGFLAGFNVPLRADVGFLIYRA
jgi:hypothetical protein